MNLSARVDLGVGYLTVSASPRFEARGHTVLAGGCRIHAGTDGVYLATADEVRALAKALGRAAKAMDQWDAERHADAELAGGAT